MPGSVGKDLTYRGFGLSSGGICGRCLFLLLGILMLDSSFML